MVLNITVSDNLSRLYQKLDRRISLLSGFQLTIIMLIVLPSAVVISHYFMTQVAIDRLLQKYIYSRYHRAEFRICKIVSKSLFCIPNNCLCGRGNNLPSISSAIFHWKIFCKERFWICSIRIWTCQKNSLCCCSFIDIFYSNRLSKTSIWTICFRWDNIFVYGEYYILLGKRIWFLFLAV